MLQKTDIKNQNKAKLKYKNCKICLSRDFNKNYFYVKIKNITFNKFSYTMFSKVKEDKAIY